MLQGGKARDMLKANRKFICNRMKLHLNIDDAREERKRKGGREGKGREGQVRKKWWFGSRPSGNGMCTEGKELQNKGLHFGFVHKVHQPGTKARRFCGAIHAQHTMDARSTRERPSDISNQAQAMIALR